MIQELENHGTGSILHINKCGVERRMRLLIAGGLGFIGSNFIRYALINHSDIEIINVDKLSYGANPLNLKDYEHDERYKFIKCDITNKKLMRGLVKKVDAIVNFAAETHVDRSIANPWPFLRSNVEGVLSILEAMRKHADNVRLVHVSTDEVYGDLPEGSFTEEDRLKPSSPYAASKAAADMLCLSYHRTYGLDLIIARCTNNYGPYQFPEKLIPKTIIRSLLNLSIPLYGKGQNIRDWIYVQDFCEAIYLLLKKGKSGEIYNISAGNELKNIDVVKMILNMMDKPESLITFVDDRPGHDIRYSLNSSKIRYQLGWRPRYRFQEGLKATIDWYIVNEWWWKPLATEKILHPTPWKIRW
ncbi:MAG: dTDP-glucose 4,6-dehydratase [Ignisphaera sp.]